MSHRRILGVAALAAAATVVTAVPSAGAATPTSPAYSGSTYAAKLPGLATPVAADGFQCKNLPNLPQLPKLPDLSQLLGLLQLPQGSADLPPATGGGDIDLSGLGTISDLSTNTKLIKQADGSDGVTSTNSIGDITLNGGPLGTLDIAGLSLSATATAATTTADPSATGNATASVGDITLTKPDGTVQKLSIPTPGKPTDVPGFGTISLGGTVSKDGIHTSSAQAQGLLVTLAETGKTYVIGGVSALANDGNIPGLAQTGELDPKNIIDLLCNADPQQILQQLAQLPPKALAGVGLTVTKNADGTYTGALGDAGSLSLGLSGVSVDQGLAHLKLSSTPDGHLSIGGDLESDGPLTLQGTLLGLLPGLDRSYELPNIASFTAGASTTSSGASVTPVTLTALDDRAKLVSIDGTDLTLTPGS